MSTLSKELRRILENTVADARKIAEAGAEQALKQLAVHRSESTPAGTVEEKAREKALREKLRAHGKQLGDRREPNGTQELKKLRQACAYEHWHRMLFARFLAENDLLIHPEYGEAISLNEVKELARERNTDWLSIAASYAQQMLIEVFRLDDPVLELVLPPETSQKLDEKLTALPTEVFISDDSLGWVYQFWQSEEKDSVNKLGVKIGADELPAVTQLFTEDYMVLFLLHNTLGAWWTAKRRAEGKDPNLNGYEWNYLRLNDDGSPVAGAFDGWPRNARSLRVLDPCMGSGHFLTFALPILARMRQEEEGLGPAEAIASTLRDNLFGLELDPRCSQIAAFNLALSAWRLARKHFQLPSVNLACSGLCVSASEADWVKLAGGDRLASQTMQKLYNLFQKAPIVGSLLDPNSLDRQLFSAGFLDVTALLEKALTSEEIGDDKHELAVAAKGVMAAAHILASQFTLVVTNVPYLGRGGQAPELSQYCEDFFFDARADLATCFVDRCLRFCKEGGSIAVVTKHELLFKPGYIELRKRLLRSTSLLLLARLGSGAFDAISGEIVNVVLLGITRQRPSESDAFLGFDTTESDGPKGKAAALRHQAPTRSVQREQLANPDSRVVVGLDLANALLGQYATFNNGLQTGDYVRFARNFWEFESISPEWCFFQSTVERSGEFGGLSQVLHWSDGNGELARSEGSVIRGRAAWGRKGVAVSAMGELRVAFYSGELYDDNTVVLTPFDESDLAPIWCYCKSPQYYRDVRKIDQALKVRAPLVQVPFDLSYWQSVADEEYPSGLPLPSSPTPTQWPFEGGPTKSDFPLQVALCRLLGYRWPRQTGSSIRDCSPLDPDGLEKHVEADGVVSLSSLAGKPSAADRLRILLSDAYGASWTSAKLSELLSGCESLEVWLRDCFFGEHIQVFEQRPFIWHVWDGRKDGFHALVNYHKLTAPKGEGRKTLEKLIYTTLGDWISRQKAELASGADGADVRLNAALHLKTELEGILAGEKPSDLFVRWKPLHEQPVGWEPDQSDGVRVNIRPWLAATPYQPSRKDACILRVTPRMNYGKDRGKEASREKHSFPWFWSWDDKVDDFLGGNEFDGARWNDLHYSLKEKYAAREREKAPSKKRL